MRKKRQESVAAAQELVGSELPERPAAPEGPISSKGDDLGRTSLTTRSCVLTIVPSSISCWVKSIVG